ncbi:MAG: putative PEP-binding protein, partial [Planctomycetota bacterium]
TGNERFAWDAYRRLLNMFGDVVMGVGHEKFEHELDAVKKERGAALDTDLDADGLQEVVERYKRVYREGVGEDFPQDPRKQLEHAINAVFSSWNNTRARKYREINEIRGLIGTAVNVQTMVFGNMGETSGTGVAFTRDPATGEDMFYGEYLMNAQGEDVVAGIRTPQPISQLEEVDPKSYKQLVSIRDKLEKHYTDMQDVEFTIEDGRLFMLQTRTGKRTTAAAVRIAVEMVEAKLITKEQAVLRVEPQSLDQLLHPAFDAGALAGAQALAKGLPASPGAAVGKAVFSADDAEEWAGRGETVILVRIETSPEDVGGMHAAKGILTSRGGMTSHAAVVARGMGKCCVAGAGDVRIDYASKSFEAGGVTIREGEEISLDGSTGTVYGGSIATVEPELTGEFGTLMGWADEIRRLGVRTNADTPGDTEVAVRFGAEGIGLTRTEHMFFEGDRIVSFRRLILVADEVRILREQIDALRAERDAAKDDAKKADADARIAELRAELAPSQAQYNKALEELLPLQRGDFEGIFRALDGRPCTVRLLDPPLHEFLPHDGAGQEEMSQTMGVPVERIKEVVEKLHEFNPMLGHRGCRLGITYPEVTEMQARGIIEAALNVKGEGIDVHPEIMVPLVGIKGELDNQEKVIREIAEKVFAERGDRIEYLVGTMIEIPRAAVTADKIAQTAEFFSFGTNDLTQMGCGFSRDDAGKFLGEYVQKGIFEKDPFQVLDQEGIGEFVRIAIERGRSTSPGLKIGICGEHGGEPASVKFCHRVGMDYVSCSPYRVPIARLSAAQAAIEEKAALKGAPKAKGKKVAKKKSAKKKAKKKA